MKASLYISGLTMLFLLVSVCGAQEKLHHIQVVKASGTVPITIVEISLGDTKLTSGDEFSADDSWVKDLTLEVKNVSNKNILWVGTSVDLRREGKQGMDISLVLDSGTRPLPRAFTKAQSDALTRIKRVRSDETVVIRVPPRLANAVLKRMGEAESSEEYIVLHHFEVIFEDGTMWRAGMQLCPDPDKNTWLLAKSGLPCGVAN